jgi:hypothetical protein
MRMPGHSYATRSRDSAVFVLSHVLGRSYRRVAAVWQ